MEILQNTQLITIIIWTLIYLITFILIMFGLKRLRRKKVSYSKRVLVALVIGILFGAFIHFTTGTEKVEYNDESLMELIETQKDTLDSAASYLESNIDSYVTYVPNLETYLEEYNSASEEEIDNALQDRIDTMISSGTITEEEVTSYSTATNNINEVMSIVSGLYIKLLQLLVIPLILVSISLALIDSRKNSNTGKKIGKVITILMVTVAISAFVGIATMLVTDNFINISDMSGLLSSQSVVDQSSSLQEKSDLLTSMSFSEKVLSPVPTDFSFFTGGMSSAALATVLFGMFLGYSVIQVDKRKPEVVKPFIDFLQSLKAVVLSMVLETLKITPYAVVALMASLVATTSFASLGSIFIFVIATYIAIIIMEIIHLVIISAFGLNPIKFLKKIWEVLIFGFTSRSSMAALPLNIRTQTEKLGVDEASANISGSFGTTIGQNGCAGIYPAMVVVATWLYLGHTISILNIIMLVIVIMISSFGIAGVGGGASFAAVAVLSIMGLPVTAAAILISVEPLLDMARTALNISGSMLTGVVTSKSSGELDGEAYNE